MQKFVVKKSKSAPLASIQSSPPPPSSSSSTNEIRTQSNDLTTIKTNAIKILSTDSSCISDVMTTNPPTRSSTSPALVVASSVKMSGYLKKKRNKMGGWRKLWFVLQNQLLLSYSSKEDYERKLAPFKDVLNLVPGTMIRPTKGPRFTIETSTNLIYTYRCDNNNECSEWITALVESLGLNSIDTNKLTQASSKLHFSMENLSKVRSSSASSSSASPASSFISSSRSCDSIYRIEKSPSPLINKSLTDNKLDAQKPIIQSVRNFRLHPTESHTKQSYEVYQINRMFNSGSNTGKMLENGNEVDSVKMQVHSTDERQQQQQQRRHHHHHHHHHHHQQQQERNQPFLLDKNCNKNLLVTMTEKPINFIENENCCLEEKIQSITLETIDNEIKPIMRKKSAALSIISSGSSTVSTASTASASKFQLLKTPEEDDEDIDLPDVSKQSREPIYAVVNLKDKYEHRAKKKSINRERPNSFHVMSTNDYEEVLANIREIDDTKEDDDDDDENIYEPISIPELSTKGPLWRYFPKINIDTLIEVTRWKKEYQQNVDADTTPPPSSTTTTFADIRKRFGQHRKSLKNRMKKLYHRNGDDEKIEQKDGSNASGSPKSMEKVHQIETVIKKDAHLFNSMLKKSRTSLTFDDTPRKRIIMAIGGNRLKSKSSRNLEVKNT